MMRDLIRRGALSVLRLVKLPGQDVRQTEYYYSENPESDVRVAGLLGSPYQHTYVAWCSFTVGAGPAFANVDGALCLPARTSIGLFTFTLSDVALQANSWTAQIAMGLSQAAGLPLSVGWADTSATVKTATIKDTVNALGDPLFMSVAFQFLPSGVGR